MSFAADSSFWSKHRLEIWKKIGEGTFGKVYLTRTGETVDGKTMLIATKVIDKNSVPLKFKTKFLPRELDVHLKLKHPFVIKVYSIFQHGSKVYTNMEYAANGDMFEFLKTNTPTEPQIRLWLTQILWAVGYVHSVGAVHRDIKCHNILLTGNYNVRVADFGFARFLGPGRNPHTSTVCGTLAYSSPELVLAAGPYDPVPADVWAIGVVLYTMANNVVPFRDKVKTDLHQKQMAKDYAFRKSLGRSESLKALTASFLEPDVFKRVDIRHALRDTWIRETDIRTPTNVRQAAEIGEMRKSDMIVPDITPATLVESSFHRRVADHRRSDSVCDELFAAYDKNKNQPYVSETQ